MRPVAAAPLRRRTSRVSGAGGERHGTADGKEKAFGRRSFLCSFRV